MAKWCNFYHCWCDDVGEIIDEPICDMGCNGCEDCEEISQKE